MKTMLSFQTRSWSSDKSPTTVDQFEGALEIRHFSHPFTSQSSIRASLLAWVLHQALQLQGLYFNKR